MSKAELSREGQKWRRLRAWDLWQQGWKQKDIATALGVTKGAVSQWVKQGREEGVDGLRRRTTKGAKSRMSSGQQAQLPLSLLQGAEAFGYRGNVWTGQRVAEVIKRVFGISSHSDHCRRLLRQMGWSVQKPIERATQRHEGEKPLLPGSGSLGPGAYASQRAPSPSARDSPTLFCSCIGSA